MKTIHAVLTFLAAMLLLSSTARAEEPAGLDAVPLVKVLPAQSGLTHTVEIRTKDKSTGIKYPWMSPLVDIDGDGDLDVIYYGHHGGGAAIWLGKGDGTFALDPTGYEARWVFGGRDPLWWDFTGDGKLDAVGVEGYKISGHLFVNDGTGHWTKTKARLAGTLLDLDGDGRHDELWARRGNAKALAPELREWTATPPEKITATAAWGAEDLLGWPAGEKRSKHPLAPAFHSAYSVDLDGDYRNELIVTFKGAALRTWLLRRPADAEGAGGWADATAKAGLPTDAGHWLFPEDIDTDGDLDLIDLLTGNWFVNDGKGRFTPSAGRIFDPAGRKYGKVWDGDGQIDMLDLDNDGRRDLLTSGDHTTANGVFLNRGGGTFTEVKGIPSSRRHRKFGDVDGDGDLDMVVCDKKATLYRNETKHRSLRIRLVPKAPAEAQLGCTVWVRKAGGQTSGELIHYRQCFMARGFHRSNVFDTNLHVGLGDTTTVDIRVRFPSGVVREVKGAKAGSQAIVKEEG